MLRLQSRKAILLIGRNKKGDNRFYEKYIPIADKFFEKNLDLNKLILKSLVRQESLDLKEEKISNYLLSLTTFML